MDSEARGSRAIIRRRITPIMAAVFLAMTPVVSDISASGGRSGKFTCPDIEMSPISGSPMHPRRHFRLRSAARITEDEAIVYYSIVRNALAKGYARSGLPATRAYQGWQEYNTSPYRSSTHGNHYVNNYANETASAYGNPNRSSPLPVGSIVAKDSFAVTETGGILLGPLFLMEKMPDGFHYVSGDWRYTLVQPDGSVLGQTLGRNSERVEYCIACHLAAEHQDHLFGVPKSTGVDGGSGNAPAATD